MKALFATRDRQSPIGSYSIDIDGDPTLTDYGVFGIVTWHAAGSSAAVGRRASTTFHTVASGGSAA